MKIGIVAPFNPSEFRAFLYEGQAIPNVNKAASSVNAIALGLLHAGHEITVVSSYDEPGPVTHIHGDRLTIHLVSSYSRIPKSSSFMRWYMVKRLRKLLSHHLNEMEVIHAHWTYEYALASCAFSSEKPVFCTIRDWAPIIRRHLIGMKPKAMWWLVSESLFRQVMNNKQVYFIANSHYIYNLVRSRFPQVRCFIIENPIKKEFIREDRTDYPFSPVIVSIAQNLAEPRKNFHTLLCAFQTFLKSHSDATLKLIGQYKDDLISDWERQGIARQVEFLGFVNHDELISILDSASILIHPSLEESFGNTLLEGMARRLPVIGGASSGAVPHVLAHGKYGILCDIRNPEEIAEAMERALDLPSMRPILDQATAYLKSELTNEIIAERHIQLFSNALKE